MMKKFKKMKKKQKLKYVHEVVLIVVNANNALKDLLGICLVRIKILQDVLINVNQLRWTQNVLK